jgi:hypothetical protein
LRGASLSGQLSLQKGFQGDGVVMLGVFGSEQECDHAITRRLQDRLPGLWVGLQFGGVLPLELFPPGRVMMERLGVALLSMLRAEQNHLLVGTFDLNAVGLDARVILEGLVDDAAVEGAERLQLDDVAPAADFLGSFHGLLDEGITGLGTVAAYVHGHLRHGRVLLEEHAVGDVLEVGEGLALTSDEAARIVSLYIEQETVFQVVLLHGGWEAK